MGWVLRTIQFRRKYGGGKMVFVTVLWKKQLGTLSLKKRSYKKGEIKMLYKFVVVIFYAKL